MSKKLPTEKEEYIESLRATAARFSPIENQAGERVGVVNHIRLIARPPATPTT